MYLNDAALVRLMSKLGLDGALNHAGTSTHTIRQPLHPRFGMGEVGV